MESVKVLNWIETNTKSSGWGWGSDLDISSLNGEQIFYIDGVPTIFKRIIGNLAKGFIVNLRGFTKSACYIVRGDGYFAHGETAKEAQDALFEKILEDKPEEERIEDFIAHFPKGKKAKGNEYYEWHHILTGSCKFGRDEFVRQNHIDLNSEYTPEEFIEIVKNAYGSDIIKQLKREYEKGGEK